TTACGSAAATASFGSRARTPSCSGSTPKPSLRPTSRRRGLAAPPRAAAAVGVGPEVVACLAEPACLVTAFIEARPVPPEELRTLGAEVSQALKATHAGPPLPASFSPFARTRSYEETARERGGTIPAAYPEVRAIADEIEA